MTDEPQKKEEKNEPALDPMTALSKRLDDMEKDFKAQLATKDALLDKANKNMAEMMDVNKSLFAQVNAQAPKPNAPPKEKTYDEIAIESAVGRFKEAIEISKRG